MRKTIKRLGAVLLAMAMAVSVLCTGALAAETGAKTYSISIKSTSKNHTYSAYQVFAGTLGNADGKTTLGITGWGNGVKSSELLTELQKADENTESSETTYNNNPFGNKFVGKTTAADVASVVATFTDDDAGLATEFAKVVAKHLTTDKIDSASMIDATVGTDGKYTYTISGLSAGYYLVKDTGTLNANDESYTNYILKVTEDGLTIDAKEGVPTVDKTVQNETAKENDSKDATTAGYGDTVNFTLTGTLPDNYADYEKYALTFHDTMANTLEYTAGSVEVKYQKYKYVEGADGAKGTWQKDGDLVVIPEKQGTTETVNYTVSTSNEDNHTVDIAFSNVKDLKNTSNNAIILGAHDQIIVTYKATVKNTAAVGSTANNFNKVYLEYSNDPNDESKKGNTPEDEVKVYTFQLNIVKNDDKNATLTGAKFVLAKEKITDFDSSKITEYKDKLIPVTAYTESTAADTTYYNYVVGGSTYEMGVSNDGKLNIKGLNEGTYYLYETEAPAGYNKLTEPVEIMITASKNASGAATGSVSATLSGAASGNITETTSGILDKVTVVNKQGSTLPSTGGMGTKLFYTIGGILMAGAAIVLVVRKRRSDAE